MPKLTLYDARINALIGSGTAVKNILHPTYGADRTGSTDSGDIIQGAIDDLAGADNSYGTGVVYCPGGTYRCDRTLHVPNDGILLVGDGMLSTVLSMTLSGTTWVSPDNEFVGILFQKTKDYLGGTITGSADAGSDGQNTILVDTGIRYLAGTADGGSSGTTLVDSAITTANVNVGDLVVNNTDNTYGVVATVVNGQITTSNGDATWAAGESFTIANAWIGDTVRNTTTGAWGQITAVSAGQVTHTSLYGGGSGLWATGNNFRLGGPPVIRWAGLRNLSVDTPDQAEKKVGVRVFDGGEMEFEKVVVGYASNKRWKGTPGAAGADSCAMRVHGREFYDLRSVYLRGNVPLRISSRKTRYTATNAGLYGALSFDHSHYNFGGCWTQGEPFTLPWANILIDDAVVINNSGFARLNQVGGDYAGYWKNDSLAFASFGLTVDKVRWEQPDSGAVANWHLEFNVGSLQEATFANCNGSFTSGASRKGIYCKNVQNLNLAGGRWPGNASCGPIVEIASGMQSLNFRGLELDSAGYCTFTQSNLYLVPGFGRDSNYKLPHTGTWTADWQKNGGTDSGTYIDYTITAGDAGRLLTNQGQTKDSRYYLPSIATVPAANEPIEVTIVKVNIGTTPGDKIYVYPQAGDNINAGTNGKALIMSGCGAVKLRALRNNRWIVISESAPWDFEA